VESVKSDFLVQGQVILVWTEKYRECDKSKGLGFKIKCRGYRIHISGLSVYGFRFVHGYGGSDIQPLTECL
jgi:hypothetical protein